MNSNYHQHSNAEVVQPNHFTSNFHKENKSSRSQSEFGISRHPSLKLFNMHSKGKRNYAQAGSTKDSAHATNGWNENSKTEEMSQETQQFDAARLRSDNSINQFGGQSAVSQSSEEGYSNLRVDKPTQKCKPVNARHQDSKTSNSCASMNEQIFHVPKPVVPPEQPIATAVFNSAANVNEIKHANNASLSLASHQTNIENAYEDILRAEDGPNSSTHCDRNPLEDKPGFDYANNFSSQMNDLVINIPEFSNLEVENEVPSQTNSEPEHHNFAHIHVDLSPAHEIPFLTEESRESFSKNMANGGTDFPSPDLHTEGVSHTNRDSEIQRTSSVKTRIAEIEDRSRNNSCSQETKISSETVNEGRKDIINHTIDSDIAYKQNQVEKAEGIMINENAQLTCSQRSNQTLTNSSRHATSGRIPSIVVTDLEPAIVIDNGSGYCKAGFAGENSPRLNIPSIVGKPRFKNVIIGYKERDKYIGEHAQRKRGVLALSYPIESGIIINWDDMEALWEHTIFEELGVDPLNHAVLMTEAPMNPKQNREEMIEIIFEKFNSPAAYIAIQAILSLYASGRTTGLVLDSGDGVSHSVPVYDGYYFGHAVDRSDTAGRDVTEYLRRILTERGYAFANSAEYEIVKDIKEKMCSVSSNFLHDLQGEETTTQLYELPDGTKIEVGNERFRAPECLFRPSLIGTEGIGIHKLLLNSLFSCDIDNRKHLSENIILSGGNVLFPGFTERLHDELEHRMQDGIKCEIKRPYDSKNLVWSGGSILAGLESFVPFWISKTEYEDEGRHIVHKKCF